MADLLLPPSCNWFQHNGTSSRTSDSLFITACFRNIAAYHLRDEAGLPELVQFLPHRPGKVNGIAIYPDSSHPEFGNTVGIIGDQSTLSLANFSSGAYIAQHQVQKTTLQSLCWGFVSGEDIIAAVGSEGALIIWQPKYLVARTYNISKKNLSVIEILPDDGSRALIASDKLILLVSLKQGEILSELKGHDYSIYCLRWYSGTVSPILEDLQVNTRWKREEDEETAIKEDSKKVDSIGPYFASSDLGRNIFIWDLSLKRYIVKTVAPFSTTMNRMSREKSSKHHITLNWVGNNLYSSTVTGEIISWTLFPKGAKYKLLHHHHTRAIFNMEIMNKIMLTFSQDRTIEAFHTETNKRYFQVQTLGSCANAMSFCPHDAHRLALGLQEGAIRLLTFEGNQTIKSHSIHNNIKEKVFSLSWHPSKEGTILFGASNGEVGITDVYNGKTSTFSYYHQKATYKVEWAPPLNPSETGLLDSWYAYSFGDREIVIRNPDNLMDDPLCINPILKLEIKGDNSFSVSEFAFSPDYEYFAVGSLDGVIKIFERTTAKLKVNILRVRKTIQHLLWKPPSSSDIPYVLAIGSAETNIYLFDLEETIKDLKLSLEPVTVTQPLKELSAHTARVVWLSWSPHQDGILASASYDHTVQIWNTNTGEPLVNYGGHNHRVFRVEFSPFDPDLMISFAEENCIHQWRPSKIKDRTPKESSQSSKKAKPKYVSEENADSKSDESGQKTKKSDLTLSDKSTSGVSSAAAAKKAAGIKAFFPLFHNVSTRRKSFLHMCILSSMEIQKGKRSLRVMEKSTNGVSVEDELFEDNLCSTNGTSEQLKTLPDSQESLVTQAVSKYLAFMPHDQPVPEAKDICQYINFFGDLSDLDELVSKEIENHKSKENYFNANIMHCWQGSLESHIKWASKQKQLDSFLVSLAPQVSLSLWENACEAYAEQLVEAGQPATGATYLLAIRKDEEAIDLLLCHKLFREALTLAKYRMGFNIEALNKVVNAWTPVAVNEGNFELACTLQLSIGNMENGARLMARRTEPCSLIVAAKLYEAAQQEDLAYSTAALALKEASLKHEFEICNVIIKQMHDLSWYKNVSICHEVLLDHIKNYFESVTECALSPFPNVPKQDELLTPIKRIIEIWNNEGGTPSLYREFYNKTQEQFSTLKMPTSLKQLWYLISKSLTMMLLDKLSDNANYNLESHLSEILKYAMFWGKNDQMYYLTRILLPNGLDDTTLLGCKDGECCPAINQLRLEYVTSEANELLKNLENYEIYIPWNESNISNGITDSSINEINTNNKANCYDYNAIASLPSNDNVNLIQEPSIDPSDITTIDALSTPLASLILENIIKDSIIEPSDQKTINDLGAPASFIPENSIKEYIIEPSELTTIDELNTPASLIPENSIKESIMEPSDLETIDDLGITASLNPENSGSNQQTLIIDSQSESNTTLNVPKIEPMYLDKDHFIKTFQRTISIWNTLDEATDVTSLNSVDRQKILSHIIVKLCERSAINESCLRDLLSNVQSLKC